MNTQEKLQQAFQTACMLADQIAAIRREVESRPDPPCGKTMETKSLALLLGLIGDDVSGVVGKLGAIS